MNTEKRLLKILDVEAADSINALVIIGETIEYVCDGVTRNDLVTDKSAFSVTVKQPICRLIIPIEYTTIYQLKKAELDMARPKKSTERVSMPPVGHPSEAMQQPPQQLPGHDAAGNLMLPPGSPTMPTAGFAPMPMPPLASVTTTLGTEYTNPPREVTIPQVQGDPDWVGKAIDDMVGVLSDSIKNLVENAWTDAAETATAEPTVKTCFDCVHIDIEGNRCALFKMSPPFVVMQAPEGKCDKFIDGTADIPM